MALRLTASNRNEYLKIFWVIERGRRVRMATSPPSLSRAPRKCGSLHVSQSYRLPSPVTGITLLNVYFYRDNFTFIFTYAYSTVTVLKLVLNKGYRDPYETYAVLHNICIIVTDLHTDINTIIPTNCGPSAFKLHATVLPFVTCSFDMRNRNGSAVH
jgi:hypothetical protein